MSFLDRINESNRHDMRRFRPFRVAGQRIGFVESEFAKALQQWPEVFTVNDDELRLADDLNHPQITADRRSEAVHQVLLQLREQG